MSFFGFSDNLVELPNLRNTQVETYFVTVPPAQLPISLALVKEHLKLSLLDNTQDAYLTLLIRASSDFFEKYTNRILINTTFITYYDKFRQSFELFKSKLQAVESFKYSSDGSLVDVDPTTYYVTQEDTYSR
ncbi:MAG: phage head-tail connector protein, partial [Cyclobacteriaceae bacterium]